jgi:hypothetical protein
MTIIRLAVVLVFAVVSFAISSQSYGAPLVSCTDIGKSSGDYTITGMTYRICSGCADGKTTADVNALALKSGDAVLFKAGETFHIGNEANRLKLKSGVLYGRYGNGANPVITASGILFEVRFRGVVDLEKAGNNITIDGIDVHGGVDENFNIFMRDVTNARISNLKVTNGNGGGIGFERGSNVVVDRVMLSGLPGRPHESLTFDGTNGYVVSHVRSTGGGHAAINNKGNARNGEIYGSEFSSTNNDPTFYIERGENIHVHDNWIHTNVESRTRKALFSLGVEYYGDPAKHYVRNIEINNNIIENAQRIGLKFFLKETIDNDPIKSERVYDNIHRTAELHQIPMIGGAL